MIGRRPVAGQLRGPESRFRRDFEARRAPKPHRAYPAGANQIGDELARRGRPLGKVLAPVGDTGGKVEPADVGGEAPRRLELAAAVRTLA